MHTREVVDDEVELRWRRPRGDGTEPVERHGVDADPRIPVLEYLGVRIAHPFGDDAATSYVELDLREDLRNLAGFLQGGMLATLLDVAAGVCAARASGSQHVLTQDLDIRYLHGVQVGPARAVARVMRAGKRSVVVAIEVTDRGAPDPRRVCTFATCTLAIVGPRRDTGDDAPRDQTSASLGSP